MASYYTFLYTFEIVHEVKKKKKKLPPILKRISNGNSKNIVVPSIWNIPEVHKCDF